MTLTLVQLMMGMAILISFYDEIVLDDFDDFSSPALGKARCQLGLGWRHLRYQLTQIQQLKQL